MAFHKNLTGLDIHTLVAFTFDDAGTRTAYSYTLADVGKMAHQVDNDSFWLVKSVTGTLADWQEIGAGGGADPAALTAALETAWSGTAIGQEALAVATAALTTSWVGTSTGHEAYDIGKAALETAWIGTASAFSDSSAAMAVATAGLSTSWAGTSAAREARAVAQTALETAWTGTRLDTLSDVTITSPLAAQSLVYDGSKWVNSDPVAVASPTFYTGYYDDTPSVIPPHLSFTTVPAGTPTVVDTVSVGGATRGVFIESYITGTLARTYLSPGIWEFNHYLSVDNASRPAVMTWDVYVRTAAGVEQFWFSGTSSDVSTTSVTHDTTTLVQDARNVSADSRLLVRLWAYRNSVNAVNLSFYHNGGTHNSHIHTPFGVAHNDLAGLQGGQAGEYFHLTSDQQAAVGGSSGAPSASNKFVTQNDSILANGAEARRFASGAYDLAVVGTNAASTAQQSADSAQAQIATISTIILVAQSGTYSTLVAQVPNWKSDVPVTVQNGVVTAVGASRYNYVDFRNEPIGLAGTAIGQLATGFTWNGTSVIQSGVSNEYEAGVFQHDPIFRMPADEFYGSGTLGRNELYLNRGTGWAASWDIQESFAIMGTEAFEEYDIGPFVPINGTGGYGWTGTTAIN